MATGCWNTGNQGRLVREFRERGCRNMGNDAHRNGQAVEDRTLVEQDLLTDIDVEMALLTLSAQDMGEPTEDLDLSALTPTEKRVLLDLLRKRLGDVPNTGTPHPADTRINNGQGSSA